jgi:hypothetical protein
MEMKSHTLENCRLEHHTDTFKFIAALSAMEGTYTKQCGTQYTFIHDSMFEICAYQYGQQFPEQMLQYMSDSYIANYVKPGASERGKPYDLCIRLHEEQYKLVAERLHRDIQNMEDQGSDESNGKETQMDSLNYYRQNYTPDPLFMGLLFCPAFKLNIKEDEWTSKFNRIVEMLGFPAIDLSHLEKYKPELDISESEIAFSADGWRDINFEKAAESHEFIEVFLQWGEKENIAKYCRSPSYKRSKGETCHCLLPNQIEKFVEKLGEEVYMHSAFQDESVKELALQKGILFVICNMKL